MTKLFEKIVANDYIWLENFIQIKDNKTINLLNSIKSKYSIIHKAIEVRAKECFDILINIPEINIYNCSLGCINGLDIALDYYITAPNNINKYYVDKLLEKNNIVISASTFIKCINSEYLFLKTFEKLPIKFILQDLTP